MDPLSKVSKSDRIRSPRPAQYLDYLCADVRRKAESQTLLQIPTDFNVTDGKLCNNWPDKYEYTIPTTRWRSGAVEPGAGVMYSRTSLNAVAIRSSSFPPPSSGYRDPN
ncbi:hypothetical protein L596_003076 [Steinernema carpocapsae]|uniref:Uncharacterized protein n=1 Tax=Steinernema carpocapsae TaxID=34508 RepID=A0A4U8UVA9_STECR|nr:hypothetical protein L596_003076 [Steinernema carpocapsae]